ncbi:MAG: uracil-DNA glycosylase [Candidatus Methanomethylophilus sp.]|mgnify:CR=1 FL=1|nr:uracil-DNA glycosylase [Methanomethylophilus sp.]MDD3233382.1 uracil-DNA glycosylase [Methanomethylophilus sp.]MDD4222511.1 uracil-DNA glycosylase [Methanomethylophilus sp.]MDD4669236.1 uracil-DNA glycosylase [Methanomethylophilus sp.]
MMTEPEADCRLCDLYRKRTHLVLPTGDKNSPVALVGEAPGENEDLQGTPFVGRAGQILNKILEEIGLPRSQILITNTVKCRPPVNRIPMPEEMAACRPFLDSELYDRKVIVGLGKSAVKDLLGYEGPMSQIVNTRQHIRIKDRDILFIPTYHPMACVYKPDAREQLKLTLIMVKEEFLS